MEFHPGIASNRIRHPARTRRAILLNPTKVYELQKPWSERILTRPDPGKLRLLTKPADLPIPLLKYWYADMSLSEWTETLKALDNELETNPITRSMSPPDLLKTVSEIFERNQRARWLAAIVLQRWKLRVWRKKTQCNVDLIDMAEIKDKDALFLVDTNQRQIFRFHRRDVFNNLISNICMSEDMMPYPRAPTNPWSNVRLTKAQTMSICAQLSMDYAKRGACPPTLLAAYCASGYDLKKFQQENAPMLSQHAIFSYFKDLTQENQSTVYETIVQLLTAANLGFSAPAINRWLSARPQTGLHKEWLTLVRDYTVYINLHVQIRPHWINAVYINHDVRALYRRTTPEFPERRIRVIPANGDFHILNSNTVEISTALQHLLNINVGGAELQPMDNEIAMMLINATLFH
jgi:hypothetical protein